MDASAFSDTNPTDETSGRSKPEPAENPSFFRCMMTANEQVWTPGQD